MFHVILAFLLSITQIHTLPLYFPTSNTSLSITSSYTKNQLQIVFTINSSIQGQQINFRSEAFSQQHHMHTLKLEKEKIILQPSLDDQQIMFNYRIDGQYYFAMKHRLLGQARNVHFMGIVVRNRGEEREILVPVFDWKMNQIERNRLYKCQKTVVSVQFQEKNNKNSAQSDNLYIQFFTVDNKQSIWILQETWDHQWRHFDERVYFGGAHRKNIKNDIKILLNNGKYCQFNIKDLKQLQIKRKTIKNRKYQKVQTLLQQIPALPIYNKQEEKNEQL